MNRVLIDTHILVWSLFERRLSNTAHSLIDGAEQSLVSAASIYEIDAKRRIGGQRRATAHDLHFLPSDLTSVLPGLGYTLIDITPRQAWLAANLPIAHGDPWDRILLAQARDLGVPLISADRILLRHAGDTPVIW